MIALFRLRLLLTLAAAALFAGLAAPAFAQSRESALDDAEYQAALQATVRLLPVDQNDRAAAVCTGAVISPEGHILTAYRCLANPATGALYTESGRALVALTPDERRVARPAYYAELVAGSPAENVAVLKITATLDRRQPLPARLPLTPVALGDSAKLRMRDFIAVLGYPVVGGESVTYTEGQVSGVADYDKDGAPDMLKTDADLHIGHQGAPVFDAAGRLVAFASNTLVTNRPDFGLAQDETAYLRMIHTALPTIQAALEGREPPAPDPQAGVLLAGRVLDADTGRPIPNARVYVLQAGLTFAQFQERGRPEELIIADAATERGGVYQVAPGLARGQTYTVVALARNYERSIFDLALEITADDPRLVHLEDIAIKKK